MAIMSLARAAQYERIQHAVRNSPLVEAKVGANRFFFKLEYLLPYGASHYARVYAQLLYFKEMLGVIKPGQLLLETTSGSCGRAAAAVAHALGYPIHVGIPADSQQARVQAIQVEGGFVHLVPGGFKAFPDFIREFLKKHPDAHYLNHMMGSIDGRGRGINTVSVNAMVPMVAEARQQLLQAGVRALNYVLAPMGNGTSALGVVTAFRECYPNVRIVGYEPFSAPYAFSRKHPGTYAQYRVDPCQFPGHDLPGLMPSKFDFPLPALDAALPLIDQVVLVASQRMVSAYRALGGTHSLNQVVQWDTALPVATAEAGMFGRIGKTGIAVAQEIGRTVSQKTFFIPIMDSICHYDP
jgi:cysteine synthase